MTITPDHNFTVAMTGINFAGTWELKGDDAVFTPTTANGEPVAVAKKQLLDLVSKMGKGGEPYQLMADDIDKPNYYVLSDDGKTMTTDKHRDPNGGPAMTFTKQGS